MTELYQEFLEGREIYNSTLEEKIARVLNNTAYNVVNEANVFNRFKLVIETLRKTAPKKQIYLKSSLFHLLILCKDRKLCICAMPNKLSLFLY